MTITPNLWTNIQLRRYFFKPKVGERDLFWDSQKQTQKDNNFADTHLFKKITKFLEENNYLNRVIDFFGLGESILVIIGTS